MSIKIRCDQCSKKILVDEGFAGGACRCPYCKAIVMVPGDSDASVGARPQTPSGRPEAPGGRSQSRGNAQAARQEWQAAGGRGATPAQAPPRYVAPTAVVVGSPANVPATEHIPMAKPVKIQGIVALVLFALIAAMLVVAVFVVVAVLQKAAREKGAPSGVNSPGEQGTAANDETPPAPKVSGPSVAGAIKITPPVVYVIDGGGGMAETYDAAFSLSRGSIKTLASDQKFSVVVAGESADAKMGDLIGGGSAGAAAAKRFLLEIPAGHGASNLARAIDAALAMKPSTIIIFCRKAIPDDTAAKAKAGGVKIVGIAMDAGGDVIDNLTEAAKQTGGEVKALSKRDVENVGGDSD
jgi:phage FluMu protein Com